jgi:hypothetical protein
MNSTELRGKAERLRSQIPARRQASPPTENGERLAVIARSETEEIRVNWSTYQDWPFLSIRFWKRDDQGQWWPDSKRGVAIRMRELPDIAGAIAEAMELAAQAIADYQAARAGGERRIWRPGNQPAPQTEEADFDEFDA